MEDTLLHKALHIAGSVTRRVTPEDMAKSTPCTEWDVETLLNHMVYELAWVKPLLEGKTVKDVGTSLDGDLLKDDPEGSWHHYALEAIDAAHAARPEAVAHLSYADRSALEYADEVGADILIHGWDLAKAIGADYFIDDTTAEAAELCTKSMLPIAREQGWIGPEQGTNGSATEFERLLAQYGRKADWGAA